MIEVFLFSEIPHFLLTLAIGFFLYARFRNWQLIPLCFLTGLLIDLDHLVDFWAYSGIKENVFNMFSTDYFDRSQKIYVFFHGWEIALILWWLGNQLKIKGAAWALVIPFLSHLLIDQFSGYTSNPLAYFLTYRFLTNFDLIKYTSL